MTDSKAFFIRDLFSGVPREYDFLLSLLTFRQDDRWRKLVVSKCGLRPGSFAVDIASGTGLLSRDLAETVSPDGLVVAVDFCYEMLLLAKKKAVQAGLYGLIDFVLARAENLPFRSDTFHSATIGLALRNVSDVAGTFEEMRRVTCQGGISISLDFTRPPNAYFRRVYYAYIFRILPLVGRLVSREWERTFNYLCRSIAKFLPVDRVKRIMQTARLDAVEAQPLTLGIVTILSGRKM